MIMRTGPVDYCPSCGQIIPIGAKCANCARRMHHPLTGDATHHLAPKD